MIDKQRTIDTLYTDIWFRLKDQPQEVVSGAMKMLGYHKLPTPDSKEYQELREKILSEVQAWIEVNNVYKVEFGHFEPPLKTKWIPLGTKRINVKEALNG